MTMRELHRVGRLPIFQNRMYPSPEAARAADCGDIVLAQDLATGLVSNLAFRPELMAYDADYQNEQALSSAFQAHLQRVTEIISPHFKHKTLIEVGCGKGYFLEQLLSRGFMVTGMDPAYEGSNPGVRREYFRQDSGLHADGIILRHVLEHVHEPVSFLKNICQANGGEGLIYIEVPCFEWICQHRAWFDVFYEHVNYFRLGDFRRMFEKILQAGHVFGGQYLYVIADLSSLRRPKADAGFEVNFPADFTASLDRHAAFIKGRKAAGLAAATHVVWGGASKGVLFTLHMERTGAAVDHVVDINPAKQGRYLAATGHKVSSPEEVLSRLGPEAVIFVMNGNYLTEIQQMTGNQCLHITVDHENF